MKMTVTTRQFLAATLLHFASCRHSIALWCLVLLMPAFMGSGSHRMDKLPDSTIPAKDIMPQNPGSLPAQPLLLMENKGQILDQFGNTRHDILFSTNSEDVRVAISRKGISYQFEKRISEDVRPGAASSPGEKQSPSEWETYRLDMELIGALPDPKVRKENPHPYFENYYNIPAYPEGIEGVGAYQKIVIENVYPGIDWVIYTQGHTLKYDFIVHPGADPAKIKMEYRGLNEAGLTSCGELVIKTPFGEITEQAPITFSGGEEIESRFLLKDNVISFDIPCYDPAQTLVIDPTLQWATYYGGSASDNGYAVATDISGNVYLAGSTESNNGIASLGHQNTRAGNTDAFLVKLNSAGTRQWATYYGGTGGDFGYGVATDNLGNVYMTGSTSSSGGIATPGSQQPVSGGEVDAFLVKFNTSGQRLWGTYYGEGVPCLYEEGNSVATDGGGNVYVAGNRSACATIAPPGDTGQSALSSVNSTAGAFLLKYNGSGALSWDIRYAGFASSVAVYGSNDVYLAGYTFSNSNVATPNAHQLTNGGSGDAFLVKFNAAGVRQWGTYYGGSGYDVGWGVATDGSGNVYLAGQTTSTNNIASGGGYQTTYGGNTSGNSSPGGDAFLVKFNTSGQRQWGTYYGSSGSDFGLDVATDGPGNVYLAGRTNSTNSIASGGHQNTFGGMSDAFLVQFNTSGVRQWATYYGGSASDSGNGVAVSGSSVYLAGETSSTSGIALGGHQNTIGGGGNDAFLAKFGGDVVANPCQSAIDLTCGVPYNGTTSGGTSNFGISNYSSCLGFSTSSPFTAPDNIFRIQKSSSVGDLVVTLFSQGIDHDIFLFTQCVNVPSSCIGYGVKSVQGGLNNDIIRIQNAPAGTYYIVVDGYDTGQQGPFSLTVTCNNLSCTGVTPISCNQTLTNQTNTTGVNNVSTYCNQGVAMSGGNTPHPSGTGCTGRERVYSLTINQNQPVTINLTGVDANEDFDLFLLSGCNKDMCVANSTNGYGVNEQITENLTPGTYYIVVDGWQETSGTYNLSVSCCPAPTYNFNCGSTVYSYNGNQLQFSFSSGAQSLPAGFTWQVNQQNVSGAAGTTPTLTYNFPSAGNYNVCYPYLDSNGCVQYCCRSVCIAPPVNCSSGISYGLNANQQMVFTLQNGSQYTNINWYWDDAPATSLSTTPTFNVTFPTQCVSRTICVRYYDTASGCWRTCCRTIWLCNPFTCFDFSYVYVPASNGFQFTLNNNPGADSISWTVDDTGQSLGNGFQSTILPIPSNCITRTITVRFFRNGVWYICCRTILLCNPFNCFDFSYAYLPSSNGFQFTLNNNPGADNISWTVHDEFGPEQPVLNGFLPLPTTCVTRIITVRYRIGGVWYICCFRVWLCNPILCSNNILYNLQSNSALALSTDTTYQNVTWFNGSQQIGTGNTIITQPYPPGSTQIIYVRFYNPALQRFEICCISIGIINPPPFLGKPPYPFPFRNEDASFLLPTSDGGYLMVGSFERAPGNWDGKVIRTNANGAIIWQDTTGGPGADYLRSATEVADGFIVVGSYHAPVSSNSRVWIRKYHKTSGLLMAENILEFSTQQSNLFANAFTVVTTFDNRILIGGESLDHPYTLPINPSPPMSTGRLWLVDPVSLNVISSNSGYGTVIKKIEKSVDNSFSYYLFGEVFDFHDEFCPVGYYEDLIVFRLNSAYQQVAFAIFGGDTPDKFVDGIARPNGGFMLIGYTPCYSDANGSRHFLLKGSADLSTDAIIPLGRNLLDNTSEPVALSNICENEYIIAYSSGGLLGITVAVEKYLDNHTILWSQYTSPVTHSFRPVDIAVNANNIIAVLSNEENINAVPGSDIDIDFALDCWGPDQCLVGSQLTVSPPVFICPFIGGSIIITVTSNVSWTATSTENWVSIINPTGINDGSFTIVCQSNPGSTLRTAIVTVSGGGQTATVTITQGGVGAQLSVTPTVWNPTASGGSQVINVTSNVSWTASESVSWLSLSNASGANNGSFAINCLPNLGISPRSATVTVTGGGQTATVTVTQAGATAQLTVSPTVWSPPSTGGSQLITVTGNVNWTATSPVGWLTILSAFGVGNGSFAIVCSPNLSATPRSATITVNGGGQNATVTVTQEGAMLFLSVAPTSWDAPPGGGSLNVSVTSNVTWIASESASWLSLSNASGANNGAFTITCEPNTGSGTRTATVTITDGGLLATVVVTQYSLQDVVIFDIEDNVCGATGQIIEVPIRVSNFTDVLNFQMSLRLSNPSFGRLIEITPQSNLPGSNFVTVNDSTGALLWFSGTPVSLTNNSVIGVIKIQITGANGSSSNLVFTNSPTDIYLQQIINGSPVDDIPPQLTGGPACVQSTVALCGRITREDNVGVGNVTVNLTGTATQSTVTDANGNYCFQNINAGGNYVITPVKDINYSNGVNSGDLSRIQRHISTLEPLNSPYKRIAANTKLPNQINTGDLSEIQRLILGIISDFPDMTSWRFVPNTYVFPNPQEPFANSFPETITLNNVSSNQSNLDFTGIKIGDVTLNNNPGNIAPDDQDVEFRSNDSLAIYTPPMEVESGGEFTIPVLVSGFKSMYAGQFSLSWDTTDVEYIGLQNLNVTLNLNENNFNTGVANTGKIAFSWFTGSARTLADSTAIFALRMRAKGAVGATSRLSFSNNPTPLYFEDVMGEIQADTMNGTLQIVYPCSSNGPTAVSVVSNNNGTATANVTGGTPPYQFVWSNGQSGATAANIGSGIYTVSVTDSNGCMAQGSITVASQVEGIASLKSLNIIPNPTSGLFTLSLELNTAEYIRISLLNPSGQVLQTIEDERTTGGAYHFDLSDKPGGMYLLKINTSKGYLTRSIILSK